MSQAQESVYNLTQSIPQLNPSNQRASTLYSSPLAFQTVYHSKYPPKTVPTGSTFGRQANSLDSSLFFIYFHD